MNDKWEPMEQRSASAVSAPARLVTGGEADHFLPHLCAVPMSVVFQVVG